MQGSAKIDVSAPPAASAKGSNFVGLLRAIEKRHRAAAVQPVLEAVEGDAGSALRQGQVLSMGWYPVAWYADLHAAVDRTFGGGANGARSLGYEATSSDFGSVHRLVASMPGQRQPDLSIETIFGQTHRLMGLYWKGGSIERMELRTGFARLRFGNWHGFTRLVWEDLMGSIEAVLNLAGGKNTRCRALGPLDDQHTVDFEARWA